MKKICLAILGLALISNSVFSGETRLSNLKSQFEAMQKEMAQLTSEYRSSVRANAGGAPQALTSANKKATLKIGGDVKVRYDIGSNSYYNSGNSNSRRTHSNWSIAEAKITFDINLSDAASAFISFRPDFNGYSTAGTGHSFDEGWFMWKNIGGCDFDLQVGLVKMAYGMYNSKLAPIGVYDGLYRGIVTDPFVQDLNMFNIYNNAPAGLSTFINNGLRNDMARMGMIAGYKWQQVQIRAGVYGGGLGSADIIDEYGWTDTGANRNSGVINHTLSVSYDPSFIEGLHLEASYMGRFDAGQGVNDYMSTVGSFDNSQKRGAWYNPNLIIGALYNCNDRWNIHGELNSGMNTEFWNDAYTFSTTIGADFKLRENIVLSAEFDWAHFYTGKRFADLNSGMSEVYGDLMRATIGARYDFNNGIALQVQYLHDWAQTSGCADNDSKNDDHFILQTTFIF